MTSIDNLAAEIMQGLQEYADLADTAMKKAVRKSATQVKNEISANAPKDITFSPLVEKIFDKCRKGF